MQQYFLLIQRKPWLQFLLLWLLVFLVYLSATYGGKYGAFYGEFLSELDAKTFYEFVFTKISKSLYVFTQTFTWMVHYFFGNNAVLWHLLHVTLHAFNAWLVWAVLYRWLQDSGIANASLWAVCTAVLFAVSAYQSEVVVHEPCIHYALGFGLQWLVLLFVLRFINVGKRANAFWAFFFFLVSITCIEMFYSTPFVLLLIAAYYKWILKRADVWRSVMRTFFIPFLVIFLGYFIALRLHAGVVLGHGISLDAATLFILYVTKLPKYLFHILFMGRFWPEAWKESVYLFLMWKPFLFIFYLCALALVIGTIKKVNMLKPATALALAMMAMSALYLLLVSPRYIQFGGWVQFDRYIYFAIPCLFLACILLLQQWKFNWAIGYAILFIALNLVLLLRVNRLWKNAAQFIRTQLETYPLPEKSKIDLLLNLPDNRNGLLMLSASANDCFKYPFHYEMNQPMSDNIKDVAAMSMASFDETVSVTVLDAQTLKVHLDNPANEWRYNNGPAYNYEHVYFNFQLINANSDYLLTLKQPQSSYRILLYNKKHWQIVEMQPGKNYSAL